MGGPGLPDGYEGRVVEEIRTVDDAFMEELYALRAAKHEESRPGEPFWPHDELVNQLRHLPSDMEDWTCAVRDSAGGLAAVGFGGVERTGDNEHLFWLEIEVHSDHRRRGIARWLLAQAAAAAEVAGATLLTSWTTSAVPAGGAFAQAHEFESKQVHRESELDLSQVDWEMVDRWVDEGPARAPGYELVLVEGVYPEDHYDNVIAWWNIMNTAPRDDLSWNDDHLTPERLAEWEAQFAHSQADRWEYIARHTASGECVGVSNVRFDDWNPAVMHQGDTGVHPDHRGHALGKWLKAAMLQKVRAERPMARVIRTGNAYSNDAMLGINNQLGFAESRSDTAWELPVEKALKSLN